MKRYFKVLLFLFLLPSSSFAIVIEPDNFDEGTNLSTHSAVTPYVNITTTWGRDVYASSIHRGGRLAADGADTGPFGDRVFSSEPQYNSEWYSLYFDEDELLVFDFVNPVSSFSLLLGELHHDGDGSCCSSDPIYVYLYDELGNEIDQLWADTVENISGQLNPSSERKPFTYWDFEYSANNVSKILISGESEPTTVDRLEFTPIKAEVSEPSTLALLGICTLLLFHRATLGSCSRVSKVKNQLTP